MQILAGIACRCHFEHHLAQQRIQGRRRAYLEGTYSPSKARRLHATCFKMVDESLPKPKHGWDDLRRREANRGWILVHGIIAELVPRVVL